MMWLMRLRHWVDHPPSRQQMRMIVIVAALCFAVILIEWMGWWPDWAQVERVGRSGLPRF